ncbi:MAG TPA: cellulose biosynthesis cyclic di-GMP-binding regulatory protein BcsB [Anaerolineaceae bacterium]|nr:cellulose biosynthesis cyclic di-GMP-binding regulatory protein BcsB [Anaerolineaceae bacterium]
MKKGPLALLVILAVAFFWGNTVTIARAESSTVEIPLQTLNSDEPLQLQGLVSSVSLELVIPPSYTLTGNAWLQLTIQSSPLLDSERSSLTIKLNNLNITTLKTSELAASPLQISLPPNALKTGSNALTFTAALFLPTDQENDCRNWNDPARWLNFSPDSALHLDLTPTSVIYDLTGFAEIYASPFDAYLPGAMPTLIILPDEPTRDDLSGLAALAYASGAGSPALTTWQPVVVSESQFTAQLASNRHLIFVNVLPPELGDITSGEKDTLVLVNSPWDAQKALLLIADRDRQDGYTPAQVFSDPLRRVLLQGHQVFLDRLDTPPAPEFQTSYTLESLGYLDRTATGVGESSLTYRLFLPYNTALKSTVMDLILSHAPDLDTQASTITVYVNGFAVAGIIPNAGTASLAPIQANIPTSRFRPGENFIRITFNLQPNISHCERAPNAVWATINNQTTITSNIQSQLRSPTLDDFPMPFSDNPAGIFVVPDQPDAQTFARVAGLAFRFGQSALITDRPPIVMQVKEFIPGSSPGPYVLLVGLPGDNALIRDLNNLLPQPFTADGLALAPGYGVYAPTDDQPADLGVVQILNSPWEKGGVVMVVSGTSPLGLDWAWSALLDSSRWSQFKGSLLVAGSEQQLAVSGETEAGPVVYWNLEKVNNIPIIGSLLQSLEPNNLVPAAVSIIAALILMILLLIILQLGKRIKS